MEVNPRPADWRPSMTLLSGPLDVFGHCCRLVVKEKDVECTMSYVSVSEDPAIVGRHNPYGETPVLLDRDVTLYDMRVIIEYLDERFPHPPLLPADPVARAKARLIIFRLTRDWLKPIYRLGEVKAPRLSVELHKDLHDGLVALSPIVGGQQFLMGGDCTLVDACFAPLLWRLPMLGVELPKQAAPLLAYGESLFARPSFYASMSKMEMELRDPLPLPAVSRSKRQ